MQNHWTMQRFPRLADDLRRLVDQHHELKDEPLHLAIAYDPGHDSQDVFLVEIVGGLANGGVNPERDLFKVSYGPGSGFPLADNEQLHLLLTSPEELSVALEQQWPSAIELKSAIQRGDCEVLFEDELGASVLESLRG